MSKNNYTESYELPSILFTQLFFISIVLLLVFFYVVKGVLGLEGIFQIYPYAIATTFVFCGLISHRLSRIVKLIPSTIRIVLLLVTVSAIIMIYHTFFLGEMAFDVGYALRFYFGFFILFYGFMSLLCLLSLDKSTVSQWMKIIMELVILFSFLLAVLEMSVVKLGLANTEIFPWVQKVYVQIWERTEGLGDLVGYRVQGMASNSAVLGGFSLFLTLYYYSMTRGSLKLKNIIFLLLGIATVLLAKSGTGNGLLILSIVVLYMKGTNKRNNRNNRRYYTLIMLLPLGLLAAFLLVNIFRPGIEASTDRFSMATFVSLNNYISASASFMWQFALSNLINLFFGSMNIYQFFKPDPRSLLELPGDFSSYYLTFYDWAYIAFVIECGIVGLFVYLYLFIKVINLAFPKNNFTARWSFILLLLATFHYPVIFWVCTQVMAAIILTANIYIRNYQTLGINTLLEDAKATN